MRKIPFAVVIIMVVVGFGAGAFLLISHDMERVEKIQALGFKGRLVGADRHIEIAEHPPGQFLPGYTVGHIMCRSYFEKDWRVAGTGTQFPDESVVTAMHVFGKCEEQKRYWGFRPLTSDTIRGKGLIIPIVSMSPTKAGDDSAICVLGKPGEDEYRNPFCGLFSEKEDLTEFQEGKDGKINAVPYQVKVRFLSRPDVVLQGQYLMDARPGAQYLLFPVQGGVASGESGTLGIIEGDQTKFLLLTQQRARRFGVAFVVNRNQLVPKK
ncbi:MAG: hypothetical protein PHS53_02165 [Candidatus Pacebacteria bacterium]|nr:hypothetical protein [Candidatus Paceibacterota bacterium]MDD5356930.1 hypothetical protein [Candidatus Paceibacterota bacterium]